MDNPDCTVRMDDPDGERTTIDPADLAWQDARKRPAVVQATPMPAPFEVDTPEGTMQGDQGDVLICGVEGELYPCDADVFYETYDVLGATGPLAEPDAPGSDGPLVDVVRARDALSTAGNYLGDATAALADGDQPVTVEQARERREEVAGWIRDAERSIERAKRRLGLADADETSPTLTQVGEDPEDA